MKLKGAAATLVTLVSVGRWRLKMMMMWGLMFSGAAADILGTKNAAEGDDDVGFNVLEKKN